MEQNRHCDYDPYDPFCSLHNEKPINTYSNLEYYITEYLLLLSIFSLVIKIIMTHLSLRKCLKFMVILMIVG